MAEIKLEITDEMIKSAVREQVKTRLSKLDFKSMVNTEIHKVVRESWNELNADSLVKEIKTDEIANGIVDNLASIVSSALAEYQIIEFVVH